jgi:hypothetical protein
VLNDILKFLGQCQATYLAGTDEARRFINRALFSKLLVSDAADVSVTEGILHEPWATFLDPKFQRRMAQNTTNPAHDRSGRGSRMSKLVPPAGFEPAPPPPEGGALSPELRGLGVRQP